MTTRQLVNQAFWRSFSTTILSELFDKTFCIAAILAVRHGPAQVFLGAAGALVAMTALSVLMGWAAPTLISKKATHWAATALFLYFGGRAVFDFFTKEPEDEYAEAEEELNALDKSQEGAKAAGKIAKAAPSWVSVLIKAFSLTFLAEWGDRSQIATIGLAASEEPFGVGFGGFIGHALCTGVAVLGGRQLSNYVNERYLHLAGGLLFLAFGIHSMLEGPGSD